MDVNTFYTRSAAGSQPSAPTGAAALGKGGLNGGAQAGVVGFLDLLLSTLGSKAPAIGGQTPNAATEQDLAQQTLAQKLSGKNADEAAVESLLESLKGTLGASDLAHLRAALTTATGQERSDLLTLLQALVQDKAKTDTDVAAALLNLMVEPGAPESAVQTPASTPQDLSVPKPDDPEGLDRLAALLSANLTPEQIADLAQRAAKLKEGQDKTNGIAFLTALLAQNQTAKGQAAAEALTQAQDPSLLPEKPAMRLTTPAGTAATGQEEPGAQGSATLSLAQTIARLVEESRAAAKGRREARFADLLMEGSEQTGATAKAASPGTGLSPALLSALKSLTAQTKGGANLFTASPLETGASSGLSTTLDPDAALAQWLERLTSPMSAANTASPASVANAALVSPLTGAHPASQIVAAALIRTAQGGEAKTLTLNLNPPELGRVEVRMEIARDRSVKAVLSVEKPETLTLLQRDAHMLERALQSAGFDAGGESLHFELAQDGGAFDSQHGSSGHGGGSSGSGRGDTDSEPSTIETHMTWFIDPHTGTQRYDLYV